jgi:hypothetical protein
MKHFIKYIIPSAAAVLTMGLASCAGDLDVTPIDPNTTTEGDNLADYLLNKCYANMAVAGQGGANGDCDIDGLDGGTTGFVRQLFNSQELPTDEAVCGWGDNGITQFDYAQFTSAHPMLKGFYCRLYAGIDYCNQYLMSYGGQDATKTAEARFLRAYYYSVLMDGWGNVPFTTTISADAPQQIKRAALFRWVVDELKDIEGSLSTTVVTTENTDGYGRANKYTDELLLARLYLNAEVYAGVAKYDSAAYYAQQVIENSPYKLHTKASTSSWSAYQELFMGNNGQNGAAEECLLALPQDGTNTTSYGTTLFLMAGSNNGSEIWAINGTDTIKGNGTTNGWGGNRMCPDLVEKFFPNNDAPTDATAKDMAEAANDDRALFCSIGRKLENTDITIFTNGYATCKFNNYYTTGGTGKSTSFADTDFFLFRIAEAYLTYAEATARTNGGSTTTQGTAYINALRTRANASTKAGYSLSDLCDEWSREFYFEGYRRTTLIRFNRFGGSVDYNWSWKGGALNGRNIDSHYNLFAIPDDDMNANENLTQNAGY